MSTTMKTTDIQYCLNLVKTAAATMTEQFEHQERETELHALITKFKVINESVSGIIKTGLAAHFPQISWSANEFDIAAQHNSSMTADYWVCDPLDGGVHYMQGFAPWCITLALIHENRVIFSLIYEPVRQEMFYAVENAGAFLNGKPIRITDKQKVNEALIGTALPNNMRKDHADTAKGLKYLKQLTKSVFGIRMLGPASLQLAYVACGRLDGYAEFGDDIYDWLAGSLLVKEAGGVVTAANGIPFDFLTKGIVAANTTLLPQLLP